MTRLQNLISLTWLTVYGLSGCGASLDDLMARLEGKGRDVRADTLQALRDADAVSVGAYTLAVQATIAPLVLSLDSSLRTETAMISSDGQMRVRDASVSYGASPAFMPPGSGLAGEGDYDGDGNLLVVRLLNSRIAAGPGVHDALEEHQVVAVSPLGEETPGDHQVTVLREALGVAPRLVGFDVLLLTLGRGYGALLDQITEVNEEDGLLRVRATGSFFPSDRTGEWELTVDPGAGYLVRSAAFYDPGAMHPDFQVVAHGQVNDGPASIAVIGSANVPGLRSDLGSSLEVQVSSYIAGSDAAIIAEIVAAVTAQAPVGAIEEGPRAEVVVVEVPKGICCVCKMQETTHDECLHLADDPCPSPPHPPGSRCTKCLGAGNVAIPSTDGGVHNMNGARVCIHNEIKSADCEQTATTGVPACSMKRGTPIRQSLRPLAADCPNAGSTDANDIVYAPILETDRTCPNCMPAARRPTARVACDDPQPGCGGAEIDATRRAGMVCD